MAESYPRGTNKDVLFIKEFLEHDYTKNVEFYKECELSARQTETSSTEAAFSASPATTGAFISLRQPKSQKIAGACTLFFAFSYPCATKWRVPKRDFHRKPFRILKQFLTPLKERWTIPS